MEEIAEWIEDLGHIPCPWTDHDVFPLGGTTFTSLNDVAHRVDAALFIFTADDVIWYRGDKTNSPRDNVILEYGLFAGALGEKAVAFAKLGKSKLASDLAGVTYLSLDGKRAAKNKLKAWLTTIVSESKAARASLSPFQSSGKQSLFEQGTALIQKASRRIALVAKTPIPIVGTRPYGQLAHAIAYEKAQFDLYTAIAERASHGSHPEFVCVGSLPAFYSELKAANNELFLRNTLSHLKKLEMAALRPGSLFRVRWCDNSAPMTFVVADDHFLMWFKDASGENVWITSENDVIARALWDEAIRISKACPTTAIQRALK